mgnify:CR=1 FL=1
MSQEPSNSERPNSESLTQPESSDHHQYLHTAADGITRCWWSGDDPEYIRYHDEEWGQPVADDFRLFEKICLEGFQSGLSWLTILRKRENFRAAFAQFDFYQIAQFDGTDVERLLADKGIVRHRGKIEATLNNARQALKIVDEYGSLAAYLWSWEPDGPEPHIGKSPSSYPVPSITQTSKALSKDLKKRGWKFFGPTTAYAFMQAMGMVNDHMEGCWCCDRVHSLRAQFVRPTPR